MKPAPLSLPPGVCLTSVWPHLSLREKQRWVQVVEVEARAVRRDAAAARKTRECVRETAAATQQARRELLEAETLRFRVGRVRSTGRP